MLGICIVLCPFTPKGYCSSLASPDDIFVNNVAPATDDDEDNGEPQPVEVVELSAIELFNMGIEEYQKDNFAAAWDLFKQSADKGDPDAHYRLGEMSYYGKGMAQNYTEALKWFRKGAEQNEVWSQYYIGFMYEHGQGVSENLSEAAKWYKKAVAQGHVDAQKRLKKVNESVDANTRSKSGQTVAASNSRPQNNSGKNAQNSQTINYFSTGFMTNGSGGWISGGSSPAKSFTISDTKIINGDGDSYTYTGQMALFNIPVSVYVCATNNKNFILRCGDELMYALTDYGLFLSELQQVGAQNRQLSHNTISGYYNSGSMTFPSGSASSDRAQPRQQSRKVCTLCNGWGKWKIKYAPQYGSVNTPREWCEICGKYDYLHHHETCSACGGSGYQ